MDLQELGKEILAWRKAKKISQSDIHFATGLSRTTLSQLENGDLLELGFTKVQLILSFLGKDIAIVTKSPLPTFDDLLRERKERFIE